MLGQSWEIVHLDSTSPIATVAELIVRFTERATALGVTVEHVPTIDLAASAIAHHAREIGADRPLMTAELADAAPAFVATLEANGGAVGRAANPAETRDAPLGLSLAHLAVAETGSVLLAEPTLEDRGVGLLVAAQVVVCPTAALVPTLDEAAPVLRELAGQSGGGYVTLVTGPSRTANPEFYLDLNQFGFASPSVRRWTAAPAWGSSSLCCSTAD